MVRSFLPNKYVHLKIVRSLPVVEAKISETTNYLEHKQSIYKSLFQLDDSKSLGRKSLFNLGHPFKNWLFEDIPPNSPYI